jgi:tellurite resistance protein TehA-like permease
LCALGLLLYLLVLMRFDPRELVIGAGDQWIAGGALAISALTLTEISRSVPLSSTLHALHSPAADLGAVTWIIALIWLPLLLVAEVAAPRLGRQSRRWSTLFPVGMYAASGFQVARSAGISFAGSFAEAWTWVALALWALLAAAAARRAISQAVRRSPSV